MAYRSDRRFLDLMCPAAETGAVRPMRGKRANHHAGSTISKSSMRSRIYGCNLSVGSEATSLLQRSGVHIRIHICDFRNPSQTNSLANSSRFSNRIPNVNDKYSFAYVLLPGSWFSPQSASNRCMIWFEARSFNVHNGLIGNWIRRPTGCWRSLPHPRPGGQELNAPKR